MNLPASFRKVIFPSLVFLPLVVLQSASYAQTPAPVPAAPPPPQETAPADKSKADNKVAVNPLPATGGAPVDSSKYKIGPADVLYLLVWKEGEFSGSYAVHEDGKITLPLIGDLDVGGKTPLQVQAIVTDALKKYVVNPLVTVTVAAVGSKRYYMDGLCARPGEYPLVVPTTILEAISKGGGISDFANAKHIYILRGNKKIYFNYKDVIRGRHMEQNILLQNDDHIVVP
jgi:polysaccharide export outer membrane protein